MVKIAQTFAFGRKKANQGGLPGLTNGFFQQSLDSWRAFVIFVQFNILNALDAIEKREV